MDESSRSEFEILHSALFELEWTEATVDRLAEALKSHQHGCLLKATLCSATSNKQLLTDLGVARLTTISSLGFHLISTWPRDSAQAVQAWLGRRFYLLDSRAWTAVVAGRLSAIVSSQLGKDKQQLHYWPTLLEWATQIALRDQHSLLVAKGTTFDVQARRYAEAARLAIIEVHLPAETAGLRAMTSSAGSSTTPSVAATAHREVLDWLKQRLASTAQLGLCINPRTTDSEIDINVIKDGSLVLGCIDVSPSWTDCLDALSSTATRDRACISLADRLCCVSIRTNGKIAKLMEHRLADDRFPTASCLIALPRLMYARQQDWQARNAWLDRGAVGYIVPVDDWTSCSKWWARCRNITARMSHSDSTICQTIQASVTRQVCMPLVRWLTQRSTEQWSYLTHCTRGNSAAWPQESNTTYVHRVWSDGATLPADPLLMLMHILLEGRLRGSCRLTRGSSPVVSLSDVPLLELLRRREFKSHLSKWDWEPYGLLFLKSAIPSAQPVRYGTQQEFKDLESQHKPFFQPSDGKRDWSVEQEWRVLGDIDLRTLPSTAVVVFTKTKMEAEQLAWLSNFPVTWLEQ